VTVVLLFPDGREYARVDFPAGVYAAVCAGAKKLGITFDEFLELACKKKLLKDGCLPGARQRRPKVARDCGQPGPRQPTPAVHKNFFQINMSQHDQKELRALVASFGMELRVFLKNLVWHGQRELKQFAAIAEETSMDPNVVWRLTTPWHNKN